jgi:prepilin-type processing-associated H-X9-DG protein
MGYQVSRSNFYDGYHSIHVRLLPHLDQNSLYNTINFSVGTYPPDTLNYLPLSPQQLFSNSLNHTAYTTRIAAFICPSDPGVRASACSYRGNTGIGNAFSTNAEHPDSGNGLFPEAVFVSLASVPDGLSHTAAFSERVCGSSVGSGGSLERDYFTQPGFVITADDLIRACRIAARPDNPRYKYGGRWWFWTGRERTLYNHAQVPNGSVPDCLQGQIMTAPGMASARSWHPGGVNVLMADGSVRFFLETISAPVWRSFGTRNGGELVD